MRFVPTLSLVIILLCTACATDEPEREFSRPDGGADASLEDVVFDGDASTEADASGAGYDLGGDADQMRPDVDDDDFDLGPDDTGDTGVCRPNRDGMITRDEVEFVIEASAKFMVAEDVTFDTAGSMEMGQRTWDLAQDFPGEYIDVLQLQNPSAEWFAEDFPTATYFTPLSATSDLLGVFEVTADALLLLGVVSPEDGFFRTKLEYDPAVPVLSFPLQEGKTWSVETDVSGVYDGTVTVYDEVYDFEVDAEGILKTDFGNFQVVRVRTTLDRQVGFINTVIRSFAFVTECFGTVATIASQENEDQVEFTNVAELKRIAP